MPRPAIAYSMFVSHGVSAGDKRFVRSVVDALGALGVNCRLSGAAPPGELYGHHLIPCPSCGAYCAPHHIRVKLPGQP